MTKDKKILVVEDDTDFRAMLETTLELLEFKPTCVANGKEAQKALESDKFDLILSDIQMPKMNGLQLLEWSKANKPTPTILMTGFSDVLEAKTAAELGAAGFLPKPFKSDELMALCTAIFSSQAAANAKKSSNTPDSDFAKVLIDDFISGKDMQFDIFIRIKDHSYIKIAHMGEDISVERIRSFKEKGLLYLYVKKTHFRAYMGFNVSLGKPLVQNDAIAREKKVYFFKNSMELVIQNLFLAEISQVDLENAKVCVENALSILADNPDTLELLNALSIHTDFVFAHSVGVSVFSNLIAKAMGWNNPATLFKITMGGLLHDIGKKEVPRAILEKSTLLRTAEEEKMVQTHVSKGYRILSTLENVPSEVLQIVQNHHENCLGTGYPAGLGKTEIYPLAKVVSVADEFCKLVVKNPDSEGMVPLQAVQKLTTTMSGKLSPEILKALAEVFQPSLKKSA